MAFYVSEILDAGRDGPLFMVIDFFFFVPLSYQLDYFLISFQFMPQLCYNARKNCYNVLYLFSFIIPGQLKKSGVDG